MLDVLAARRRGEGDEHVVALAVEGGGMRGVVSGAMLLALRDLGFLDSIDRFYGTSSGGLNLAYLAAGGGWDALAVYYDHLTRGFVRRLPRPGRPLLDMGRVERIMRTELPLDGDAVRRSPLDVRLVLTDVAGRRPVVVPVRSIGDALVEHLLAGAWLPVLAGAPYRLGGRTYLDGGLLWPDSVYAAVAEGATHVLMLSTSTENGHVALSGPTLRVLPPALDSWAPGLGAAFRDGNRRWAADNARLRAGRCVAWHGVLVHRVRPHAHSVGRITLERAALLDGARSGYTAVRAAFGDPFAGVVVLMIALVISGGIFSAHEPPALNAFSWLVPSRWGLAMGAATVDPPSSGGTVDPLRDHSAANWFLGLGALGTLTLLFILLTSILLRRVEPRQPRRGPA